MSRKAVHKGGSNSTADGLGAFQKTLSEKSVQKGQHEKSKKDSSGADREGAEVENGIYQLKVALLQKCESREEVFNTFDIEPDGSLTYAELKQGIDDCGINVKKVSGISLRTIFNALDTDQSDTVLLSELLDTEETPKSGKARRAQKKNKQTLNSPNALPTSAKKKAKPKTRANSEALSETALAVTPLDPESMTLWMRKIAEFGENAQASNLDLRQCCLGDKGSKRLAAAIAQPGVDRMMDCIDLHANYIGHHGIQYIFRALEGCCGKVRQLVLTWNCLGDECAEDLATAIVKVPGLEDLDLSYNRIGLPGAKAIGEAIGKGPPLQVLDMRGNDISPEGVEFLRNGCKDGMEARRKRAQLVRNKKKKTDAIVPVRLYLYDAAMAVPARSMEDPPWSISPVPLKEVLQSVEKGASILNSPTLPELDRRQGSRSRPGGNPRPPAGLLTLTTAPINLAAATWPAAAQLNRSMSEAKLIGSGLGARAQRSPALS